MKGFTAFLKKEVKESISLHRVLILLSVFFLFGMLSPLLAKMMPDIFSSMELDGLVIQIPEPTKADAYAQYFKNTTQMGILVALLVFGGMISGELSRGTLIPMLTKGLSRGAVILSKFIAALTLWTAAVGLSGLAAFGYTQVLFKDAVMPNLLFSFFCLWVFGALLLGLILLSGVLFRGNFGGLILPAAVLIVLLVLSSFPDYSVYNPIRLASDNMRLLTAEITAGDMAAPLAVAGAALAAALAGATAVFRRKQL